MAYRLFGDFNNDMYWMTNASDFMNFSIIGFDNRYLNSLAINFYNSTSIYNYFAEPTFGPLLATNSSTANLMKEKDSVVGNKYSSLIKLGKSAAIFKVGQDSNLSNSI